MADLHASYPVSQFLGKANLQAGTTNTLTTVPVPAPTPYNIRSKGYSRAALTNAAVPTVDFASATNANPANFRPIPPGFGSVFVTCFDAAGTLRVCQGTVEALDGAGGWVNPPQFPAPPDTVCPFGYIMVRVGANGSTWNFGTSNFSGATGVTYTFTDISALPDRPQIQ